MEQHSALSLFTEFLRSPDPQVRRNALTALGSINSEGSFSEVVRTALTDDDSRVRRRAEDELVALGASPPAALVSVLWDQLKPGNLPGQAYALLGRLRGRGMAIRLPRLSPIKRLKFAWALRRRATEEQIPTMRKASFFGGLAGVVSLLLCLNLTMGVNLAAPGTAGISIAGLLLPLAFVLVTYRWWRPVQDQPDRVAGAFIDICFLCVCGALNGLIILCLFLVTGEKHGTLTSISVVVAAGALSFSATRAGALIAHGCARGILTNRIARTASGAAAGILILTTISAGVGMAQDEATAVVWIVLLPVLLGLACALSTVDGSGSAETAAVPVLGRVPAIIAALLLVAGVLVPAAFSLIPKKFRTPEVDVSSAVQTIPLNAFPAAVNFTVKESRVVKVSLHGDYKIGLWRGSAPTGDARNQFRGGALDQDEDNPVIDEWFSPGRYHVLVVGSKADAKNLVLSAPLPFFVDGLFQRAISTLTVSPSLVGPLSVAIGRDLTTSADAHSKPENDKADALRSVGDSLLGSSKYRAIIAYSRAILLDPRNEGAYRGRAHAYNWLEDYQSAVSDETQVIALNPIGSSSDASSRQQLAYRERGDVYIRLTEYQRALQDLNKAVELGPKDSEAYRLLGVAYDYIYKSQEAFQNDKRAIELDSSNASAYRDLADMYDSLRNFRQALVNAQKALEIGQVDAVKYDIRGTAYGGLGDNRHAVEDLTKAIEMSPDYRAAYFDRASARKALGQGKMALADLSRGLSFAPRSAGDYNDRGYFYNVFGKYSEALTELNKALQLKPDYPWAYKNRAKSLTGLGRYKDAIADLDRAIQLMPSLSEAYQFRGDAKTKLGDSTGASLDWAKAKQLANLSY
jgi:tetratricopeptide (TPR) repeat protein